jgi:hypothetical protein
VFLLARAAVCGGTLLCDIMQQSTSRIEEENFHLYYFYMGEFPLCAVRTWLIAVVCFCQLAFCCGAVG